MLHIQKLFRVSALVVLLVSFVTVMILTKSFSGLVTGLIVTALVIAEFAGNR